MPSADDRAVVAALRNGDEQAFARLIDSLGPALLRVASSFVPSRAVAEEVVQETWLGVLAGIDRFEGRSSLKTWVFRILVNTARSRGVRERRSVPFSALAAAEASPNGASVDADRFLGADHEQWPGHWWLGPAPWATPEEELLSGETREVILTAIDRLPPAQRTVVSLRDIEGWPADEVCQALELSEVNQRVLLHRARTRLRTALEEYDGAIEQTV
jgi:RNA polymerase sigma-70 factor, ECF subfamily